MEGDTIANPADEALKLPLFLPPAQTVTQIHKRGLRPRTAKLGEGAQRRVAPNLLNRLHSLSKVSTTKARKIHLSPSPNVIQGARPSLLITTHRRVGNRKVVANHRKPNNSNYALCLGEFIEIDRQGTSAHLWPDFFTSNIRNQWAQRRESFYSWAWIWAGVTARAAFISGLALLLFFAIANR